MRSAPYRQWPVLQPAAIAGVSRAHEAIVGTGDYLFRALLSGSPRRHADVNIDAPLALAAGSVYLLAIHDNQGGNTYLDAFRGSTLGPVFSKRVSNSGTDIAGTGIGLLLLGAGKVSLLDTGNGHPRNADAQTRAPARDSTGATGPPAARS
jgi:hypothetical protein